RAREPARLLDHTVRRDAAVDEPDAMGLRRVDRLAAEDDLERLRPSDEPRQAADAAQTRNEAERQLREPEAGACPAHAQVAGERDLEPSAEAEPVHGSDERLGHPEEVVEQRAPGTGLALRLAHGRKARDRTEVAADGEHATKAGDDDDPD